MGDSDDMRCAVYELSVTNLTYYRIKMMIATMERNSREYRYNIRGLLGCIFGKKLGKENNFYCSEFVYYILTESGAVRDGKDIARIVKPMDLRDLPQAKEIFRGDISMLRSHRLAV